MVKVQKASTAGVMTYLFRFGRSEERPSIPGLRRFLFACQKQMVGGITGEQHTEVVPLLTEIRDSLHRLEKKSAF